MEPGRDSCKCCSAVQSVLLVFREGWFVKLNGGEMCFKGIAGDCGFERNKPLYFVRRGRKEGRRVFRSSEAGSEFQILPTGRAAGASDRDGIFVAVEGEAPAFAEPFRDGTS